MKESDPIHCVACGEFMVNPRNHHCNPLREKQIENARLAQEEALTKQRKPTEAQRLNLGLEMLYGWEQEGR